MPNKGRSPQFLKKLRKKYRLGEFRRTSRTKKSSVSGRAGERPKRTIKRLRITKNLNPVTLM